MNKTYSETLIGAFMTCYKNVDIAKAAGLSLETVRKYKKDPEFNAVLNERRAGIVSAAVDKMSASLLEDVDALQSIIKDAGVNPAVRVTAVNTKWTHLREWRTLLEFDKRLRALELANIGDFRRFDTGDGKQ